MPYRHKAISQYDVAHLNKERYDGIGTAHIEKELIKWMVVKAEEEEEEEQKKLTAESGSVNPSINESDIINIVKEVEKDIQKQKERTN